MIETIILFATMIFIPVFSVIAIERACDNPIKKKVYYIEWKDDNSALEHHDIIKAKDIASAWNKLCRKHFFNRPRKIISIEEIG